MSISVAGIDNEVEYNNRARVAESPELMAGWPRDAAAYREQCAPRRIAYGPGARHVIDFFAGQGQEQRQDKARDNGHAQLVVFIHGGYWQAFDGSFFSHLARGLNAHGIDVALPSYDLCPQVSVADIIEQMRQAIAELAKLSDRLIVSGHSAGGHLAACMLATDWKAYDASLSPQLVRAAYAISGLFDLAPLVPTSMNKALHLDEETARAASPLFWPPPRQGSSLDAVVGEAESAEYHRQSRSVVDHWGAAGVMTQFGVVAGANHFTAIAPLADPASPMTLRLKELARC